MAGAKKRKDKSRHTNNHHHVSPQNTTPCQSNKNSDTNKGHFNTKAINNNSDTASATSDSDNDRRLFPWWTPYLVWLALTVVRVSYVQQPRNWWILHPDENFQSLEVAHTQVYGYGFRPYEFSSLAHESSGTPGGAGGVSLYRQRELQLGMHGMRSALYITFYVSASWLADIVHLHVRPFVLWKVAHAAVSSLLPLAVYRFTRVYFRSRDAPCFRDHDAASLAAILLATSAQLGVLGTHPLLNSFLSPAVFWALACVLPWLSGRRTADSPANPDSQGSELRHAQAEGVSHEKATGFNHAHDNGFCHQTANGLNHQRDSGLNHRTANGFSHAKANGISYTQATGISHERTNGGHSHGHDTGLNQCDMFSAPESSVFKSDERVDKVFGSAGVSETNRDTILQQDLTSKADSQYEQINKGVSTTDSFVVSKSVVSKIKIIPFFKEQSTPLLSGAVLGLCVYMRVDIALFAALTLLPKFRPRQAQYLHLFVCACGAVVGIALAILQDYWFYDELVVSPRNWANFNVFRNLSGEMFGKSSFFEYFHMLFASNCGLSVLAACNVVVFVLVLWSRVVGWFCRKEDIFRECEQFKSLAYCNGDMNDNDNNNDDSNDSHNGRHQLNNKNYISRKHRNGHNNNNSTLTDSERNTDSNRINTDVNHITSDVNHTNTDVNPRNTDVNHRNTDVNPRNTDTNPRNTDVNHTTTDVNHTNHDVNHTNSHKKNVKQVADRVSADNHVDSSKSCLSGVSDVLQPGVSMTLSWASLLLFYSCRQHKELRFLHNTIVLIIITSAVNFSVALKHLLSPKTPPSPCQNNRATSVMMSKTSTHSRNNRTASDAFLPSSKAATTVSTTADITTTLKSALNHLMSKIPSFGDDKAAASVHLTSKQTSISRNNTAGNVHLSSKQSPTPRRNSSASIPLLPSNTPTPSGYTTPVVACLCLLLALFSLDQWSSFPSSADRSNQAWAYQRTWDSHDVNACLGYVSARSDVTGVFLDRNFHATGGYALLHKDVPLITFLVHEFVEFDDVLSKIRLRKPAVVDASRNVSYVTLDGLSNYVSVQNAALVVKVFLQNTKYNYFVIATDRKFLTVGFQEVFAHGTMRVMQRTFDPKQEHQLSRLAANSPVGVNATVLKYEGDVLFRFHRFNLALERYLTAVRLDPAHAQTYQAVGACYAKLDMQPEAIRWLQTCAERFGSEACQKPLSITNINPGRPMF